MFLSHISIELFVQLMVLTVNEEEKCKYIYLTYRAKLGSFRQHCDLSMPSPPVNYLVISLHNEQLYR